MPETETNIVDIPQGVTVSIEGKTIEVNGQKGKLVRNFSHAPVSIWLEEDKIIVSASWPRRKVSALVGTVSSHLQNMIKGVTGGFTYKLKIVYSHFPMSLKMQGNNIAIENFLGERSPRIAKIVGDTRVTVKGDDIIVQGICIEDVGQTAANIEQATTVKQRDPRKFLDGIYVFSKEEGMKD